MVPRRIAILRGRPSARHGHPSRRDHHCGRWIAYAVLAGAVVLCLHPRPAGSQSPPPATTVEAASTLQFTATLSSSTSSSIPYQYDSFVVLGAFPEQRLSEISVRVEIDTGFENVYVPASAEDCSLTVAGARLSYESNGVFRINFRQLPRHYAQTQAVLACRYSTQEPYGAAAWKFDVVSAIAVGGGEEKESTAWCYLQYDEHHPSWKLKSHSFCGDAAVDEAVTAADALKVLRAALGTGTCIPARCDADTSGKVTAGDALRILQFSVGKPVNMLCSSCEP